MAVALLSAVTDEQIHQVCGENPDAICRWVLKATDNEWLAKAARWLVGWPVTVLITVIIAWVIALIGRYGIRRSGRRLGVHAEHRENGPISKARVGTLTGVVASVFTVTVWCVAVITILADLGVSLVPLFASAGVAAAALGFGAQSIVRDFLAGFFMLAEGQFEVGDVIDLGVASGVVEAITLRRTQVRSVDGTVWHVPNGVVQRVGNRSQQWSQAVFDLRVTSSTDLVRAQEVMEATARDLVEREPWSTIVLSDPEVWGVEDLGSEGAVIRLVVKTAPGQQYTLLRELRLVTKEAFDREGLELGTAPARPSARN